MAGCNVTDLDGRCALPTPGEWFVHALTAHRTASNNCPYCTYNSNETCGFSISPWSLHTIDHGNGQVDFYVDGATGVPMLPLFEQELRLAAGAVSTARWCVLLRTNTIKAAFASNRMNRSTAAVAEIVQPPDAGRTDPVRVLRQAWARNAANLGMLRMMRVTSAGSNRGTIVYYEALQLDVMGTMRELASFLGVPRLAFEKFESVYSPPGAKHHSDDLRDLLSPSQHDYLEAALNSTGPLVSECYLQMLLASVPRIFPSCPLSDAHQAADQGRASGCPA